MSRGRTALLAVAVAFTLLCVVLLRLKWPRQAVGLVGASPQIASPVPNSSGGLATPPAREVRAQEGSHAESIRETTTAPLVGNPSIPIEPTQGTADGLTLLLNDPVFQQVCAQLSEADWDSLQHFVTEGRKTLMAFQTEECMRRIEAGLYDRIEGYVPGETFTTTEAGNNEFHSYAIENGEARRVRFPPEEYPEMHALRDQVVMLETETRARMRASAGR